MRSRVLIMGAAGRDFHDFNTYFRGNGSYDVVAFTATQIPNIEERLYPPELAGELYPEGIPIHSEKELVSLIHDLKVEQVVFAYSDISHAELMNKASLVLANGADLRLLGNEETRLRSKVPVISVGAVRTGAGKSPTTRRICKILRDRGLKVVAIRHPMPYGDLRKQIAQRYEGYEDLDRYECTIEEREEYEPLIDIGVVVYAGVDYGVILSQAESEAQVIVWDGGNNDTPFYKSDLHIVIADPHRPGHEVSYYPGQVNVRMADVVIINKVQTADRQNILTVRENVKRLNPRATIIEAASPITLDDPDAVVGKNVLVIEDGPTVTHGGMEYGAGLIAAEDHGAKSIIDPRPYAVGSIAETYAKYPHLKRVLPAMGYSPEQVRELEETIDKADCDVVVTGTPIDIRRVLRANKPIVRARYEISEIGHPDLEDIISRKLRELVPEK